MAESSGNPLVSKSTSDSSLSVQLHPLVLLTISDYITRHTLREQEGPMVGAIIGQQNGREVTMEHAFECKIKTDPKSKKVVTDAEGRLILDDEWFAQRLEQYKEVHKAPALDLVAMFAIGSASGPQPQHIPILQQLQHHYNDSLILLLFHPDTILDGNMTGSKLPISLYESFYEPATEAADKGLQVEGWGMGRQLQMRFRELPYEVETGEAEMIAVDFVAKGSGSATAIPNTASSQKKSPESSTSKKGKAKADLTPPDTTNKENPLSPEDEDLVSSLTGKANAIKMLHQRINLIKTYLQEVPSSYLNDASIPTTAEPNLNLNQPLLRNISSLLSRLPLLTPPSSTPTTTTPGTPAPPSSLATASAEEQSDVHLVSLLSALTRSIAEAKDMGSKYAVVTKARSDKLGPGGARSMRGGFASGFGGSLEDSPGSPWGTGAGEMVPEY